jgi:hypothetical protein
MEDGSWRMWVARSSGSARSGVMREDYAPAEVLVERDHILWRLDYLLNFLGKEMQILIRINCHGDFSFIFQIVNMNMVTQIYIKSFKATG